VPLITAIVCNGPWPFLIYRFSRSLFWQTFISLMGYLLSKDNIENRQNIFMSWTQLKPAVTVFERPETTRLPGLANCISLRLNISTDCWLLITFANNRLISAEHIEQDGNRRARTEMFLSASFYPVPRQLTSPPYAWTAPRAPCYCTPHCWGPGRLQVTRKLQRSSTDGGQSLKFAAT
jgi:hypothetical protein